MKQLCTINTYFKAHKMVDLLCAAGANGIFHFSLQCQYYFIKIGRQQTKIPTKSKASIKNQTKKPKKIRHENEILTDRIEFSVFQKSKEFQIISDCELRI